MTKLLVSVRSADEARLALAGGADLIDVKEPRRGSLGAATSTVWAEVSRAVGNERPLSAALGELVDFRCGGEESLQEFVPLASYRFAKLGLAGCASLRDWQSRWEQAFALVPESVAPVAVAYADYEAADAPPLEVVCQRGREIGCQVLLIDTFRKDRGGLFEFLSLGELTDVINAARSLGMTTVLAGSLRMDQIERALTMNSDYLAVRGAVCRTMREGSIDLDLVRLWADELSRRSPSAMALPLLN